MQQMGGPPLHLCVGGTGTALGGPPGRGSLGARGPPWVRAGWEAASAVSGTRRNNSCSSCCCLQFPAAGAAASVIIRCSSSAPSLASQVAAAATQQQQQQRQQQRELQQQQQHQWLRSTPESHVLAKQPLRQAAATGNEEEVESLVSPGDCIEYFRHHQATMRPQSYRRLLQQLLQLQQQGTRNTSSSSSSSSSRRNKGGIDEGDGLSLQKWLMLRVDGIPGPLLLQCLLLLEQLGLCSRLLLHAAAPLLLMQLPQLRLQGAVQLLQLYVHRKAAKPQMCMQLADWIAASEGPGDASWQLQQQQQQQQHFKQQQEPQQQEPQQQQATAVTQLQQLPSPLLADACEAATKMSASQRLLLQGKRHWSHQRLHVSLPPAP